MEDGERMRKPPRIPSLGLATVVGAALCSLAGALPDDAASQEAERIACYVPDVGAIYLIQLSGLPSACLDASHVQITLVSPGWSLEGNAGTDGGATQFLGTTDDQALELKANGA